MIKVKVVEDFTFKDFDKLKNIERAAKEEKGKLFVNDTFECDKKIADYLTGDNSYKRSFVKVIEVMPEEVEEKPVKKATKTSKKK